jgi:hypothetical protein
MIHSMIKSPPSQILWTSSEADVITGGRSSGPWCASGVCLNLDHLKPGDLFFASPEDDLNKAIAKGAAAIVSNRAVRDFTGPVLQVSDVFEALRALARAARFRTHGIVMAVQGGVRSVLYRSISAAADVYEGGRHQSLGLAGMPENCCYGIFGFSPFVRPDIAMISDCDAALNSTVIESLPDNGIVIINADDPMFFDVYLRAKSCGTRSIYTYGQASVQADARLLNITSADNGSFVSLQILGQQYDLDLPPGLSFDPACLASLMILKLMGQSLARCAHEVVIAACAQIQTSPLNVNLLSHAQEGYGRVSESAFRIKSVIDLGGRGRTAVLDNLKNLADKTVSITRNDLEIPHQLGSLNLVYACKDVSMFSDARSSLVGKRQKRRMEPIAPDVLAPGDFLVFRQVWQSSKSVFSEALRPVPKVSS